jgi:hypothetical protein
MKFKELKIGQTFDWVNPAVRHNSFFKRCRKVSDRSYVVLLPYGDMSNEGLIKVGSINAEVFNVEAGRC